MMKLSNRSTIWLACACVLVASVARAQGTTPRPEGGPTPAPKSVPPVEKPVEKIAPVDPKAPIDEHPPGEQHPPIEVGAPHAEGDSHAEMERLFGEVERKLLKVNRLLEEASAGKRPAGAAAGEIKSAVRSIDELLKDSEQSGRESIAAIDRILELASEPHPSSSCSGSKSGGLCKSSGSSGKPGSQGQSASGSKPKSGQGKNGQQPGGDQQGSQPSPLDRQGTATAQREATPQGPGTPDKPGGQEPGGKEQQDATAQGGQPKGNRASTQPGQLRPGETPPASATESVRVGASGQERWGELPETTREVFRMQGGGDMPPRYREWIDAYYKRLNQKP